MQFAHKTQCPDCHAPTSNAPYTCDECRARDRASLRENVDRAMQIIADRKAK